MKAKRGRAAALRRPNLGKAAALPYQNFGLIGKSARFDLHEPAVVRLGPGAACMADFGLAKGAQAGDFFRCV
jgi:hypothetical protein